MEKTLDELMKTIGSLIHKIDKVGTEMESLKQTLLNSDHNWIANEVDKAEATLIDSETKLYALKAKLLKGTGKRRLNAC